jgi:hypothetical protein
VALAAVWLAKRQRETAVPVRRLHA